MRNNIVGWERLIILKIHNSPVKGRDLGAMRSFGLDFGDDNLTVGSFHSVKWSHEKFCSHKMTPRSKVKERET